MFTIFKEEKVITTGILVFLGLSILVRLLLAGFPPPRLSAAVRRVRPLSQRARCVARPRQARPQVGDRAAARLPRCRQGLAGQPAEAAQVAR